jgi:uncharacterized iron-regulated protein
LKITKIIAVTLLICPVVFVQAVADATVRKAFDLRNGMELESVVTKASSAQVIYVGESHDSYADHLTQLEIIRLLHAQNPNIAIGMEQFQQPFQSVLDGYIQGKLSEKELVRQSEWMERWKFDYRLYRPILSFAREHGIPVIALNIAKEIIGKVSKDGIEGLPEEDKGKIPSDIDYSDEKYRERLEKIYQQHPHKNKNGFERFLLVQLYGMKGWQQRRQSTSTPILNDNLWCWPA